MKAIFGYIHYFDQKLIINYTFDKHYFTHLPFKLVTKTHASTMSQTCSRCAFLAVFTSPCCEYKLCEACLPKNCPSADQILEQYGPCVQGKCAYASFVHNECDDEDPLANCPPVNQQLCERYKALAPWANMPDCHCTDLSACRCDVNRAY